MQVTTAGDISGTVNAQIFVNGDATTYATHDFDDGIGACIGCTDEDGGVYDDGSCEAVAEGCTDATAQPTPMTARANTLTQATTATASA